MLEHKSELDVQLLKAYTKDGIMGASAKGKLEELQKQVTAHIKALKGPYVPEI